MLYENELKALKKLNKYRRKILLNNIVNKFVSNDCIRLSFNKKLHTSGYKEIDKLPLYSLRTFLLLNAYYKIYQDFEKALFEVNCFECGIVLESGNL